MSHADAFRRDLRQAFDVDVWDAAKRQFVADPEHELTPREATGHASLSAPEHYLHNTKKMAVVPAAALPTIRVLPQLVAKPEKKSKSTKAKKTVFTGAFWGVRGGATRAVYPDIVGV
ncbi:MAG TPA: hypothetical protein VGF76_05660 [Polyangiaceae bacterium]